MLRNTSVPLAVLLMAVSSALVLGAETTVPAPRVPVSLTWGPGDRLYAALRDARPVEPEKALPPAFEAPARGVIVESSSMERPAARLCIDCGTSIQMAPRGKIRCAECTADA